MKTTISALLLLLSTVASAASVPMICNAEQCNRDPSLNKCDRTTSCIETWVTAKHHCACRDGYKSSYPNDDTVHQYRSQMFRQTWRVFVAPGVKCDKLCDDPWGGENACKEVRQVTGCD